MRGLQLSYLRPQPIPLVTEVMKFGREVESRYGPCVELLGGRFECSTGMLVTREGMSFALGWMELLQLVAGVYDLFAIQRVAPKANISLFTYDMAYGPRISEQMPVLLRTLAADPDTRQAVLFIAKPENGPTSSLPCTLTMQFLVRSGKVHAVVSMRSWDLCRGLPYDIMMFQGLLMIVGRCLRLPAGQLIVNAVSAHIYHDQKHKVPYISKKRWVLQGDMESWEDHVGWATNNIPLLERGGVPGCIQYVEME